MLYRNFWKAVWTAAFLTMLLVGAVTGLAIVIAFGVMGLLTGAISLVWNRLALEEVSYERHFPEAVVFEGEEIPMIVALSNEKPVPLTWVNFEDELPDALQVVEGDRPVRVQGMVQTLAHSTSIGWYERLRWRYRLKCVRRGLYMIGPARIESGDPFGFLRTAKSDPRQVPVLVYPRVVPLEDLGIPAGRPLGELRGGLRIYPDPSRPAGLRDYEKGDPLKTVDWKATAKKQRLQVRTFEPSVAFTVVLVVAVDTRAPYWEKYPREDLERVVTVAASVASYAAERQHNLGLFTNDMPIPANRPMTVPPGTGREQLRMVLGAIAIIRLYSFGPMYERLAEHARKFPMGATLAVVTAFLPPEFVITLGDLKKRGFKIVVLYVGRTPRPELAEGIQVHEIRDYLVEMEEALAPVAG